MGRWERRDQAAKGGRLPGCGSRSWSSGCAAVHDPRPCFGPGRSLRLGFSALRVVLASEGGYRSCGSKDTG